MRISVVCACVCSYAFAHKIYDIIVCRYDMAIEAAQLLRAVLKDLALNRADAATDIVAASLADCRLPADNSCVAQC